ncbi:DUF2971 domain-containing protein [Rufibacter immobilis]|uniref:DUF2971 domain-containing protein n=1 Tax=Rufibacter immobilis TaxID=1348778 RepID=A0A3M9MZH0_9BACT|nr:DUF2971 domain-containing protein [Rufibacter immobilis]RNI30934.1 DUF2971 domain-containing protein [Rufibacter immobilis]
MNKKVQLTEEFIAKNPEFVKRLLESKIKHSLRTMGIDTQKEIETLYHYTSPENAILIAEGNKLKFSDPRTLNDPFDLDCSVLRFDSDPEGLALYLYSKDKSKSVEYWLDVTSSSRYRADFQNQSINLYKEGKANFGICCFSETYDNPLMWSHYTKDKNNLSHSGVCFGFDSKALNMSTVSRVKYTKEKMTCNYFDGDLDAVTFMCYQKAIEWEYENEVRAVCFNVEKFCDSKRLMSFDRSYVKSLYFGARIDREAKNKIVKELKENNYPESMQIFTMELSEDSFKFKNDLIPILLKDYQV